MGANGGNKIYLNYYSGDARLTVANKLLFNGTGYVYAADGCGRAILAGGVYNSSADQYFAGSGEIELNGDVYSYNSLKPTGSATVLFSNCSSIGNSWYEFHVQGTSIARFENNATGSVNSLGLGKNGENSRLELYGQNLTVSGIGTSYGVGYNTSLNVGMENGGKGTVVMTNGTLVTKDQPAYIGNASGSTGTMTVSGGTWTAQSNLFVGYNGTGTLQVGGTGLFKSTGNSFVVANGAASTGSLVLSTGGVVETKTLSGGEGKSSVVFDGGKLKPTTNGGSYLSGISNVVVTANGGVIDMGDNDASIDLSNAASFAGTLTKRGDGTLTATSDIGAFSVEAGKLALTVEPYSTNLWYRLTVRDVQTSGNICQIGEFGLYDAEGNRINAGLAETTSGIDPIDMAAGTCAQGGAYTNGKDVEHVSSLFDGKYVNGDYTKWCETSVKPDGTEANFVIVLMRLADGSKPAATYDFYAGNDSGGKRHPKSWTIEGSTDGLTWAVLADVTDAANPGDNGYSGVFDIKTIARPNLSLSVAHGAEIELTTDTALVDKLVYDWTIGGGTIDTLTLADTGTVEVINVPDGVEVKPGIKFAAVGALANPGVLRDWRVTVNGEATTFKLGYGNGWIRIPSGFAVLVR